MCSVICGEEWCRVKYAFVHNKKTCSVGVICDDIYEYVLYMRLIGSLDNKDSILHKTLLTAVRKLENKEKRYIVSKRVSREIFISVGTRKYNRLMIRHKLPKKNPFSLILNCYNDTCNLLY